MLSGESLYIESQKINGKNNIQSYILMIFLAWLTILFRNASIFIIFGVVLFLFIHNKHGNIQLLIIGFMMLLPGLIKSFYFYDVSYCGNLFFTYFGLSIR